MATSRLVPRVKLWFEAKGEYAFGYGIARILELVDRHGSIRAAADHLGNSYRYIWGRVKQQERRLGYRLVQTQVGGRGTRRSRLTPRAQRLTKQFLALREQLTDLAVKRFESFPD